MDGGMRQTELLLIPDHQKTMFSSCRTRRPGRAKTFTSPQPHTICNINQTLTLPTPCKTCYKTQAESGSYLRDENVLILSTTGHN